MDLTKYLAMKPQVDADVQTAQAEVASAQSVRDAAQAAYDAAVTRQNNLLVVQKMLNDLAIGVIH